MKTGFKTTGGILAIILTLQWASGQSAPQFTGVAATDEGAIMLTWTSTNHELYQIQYATALNTNSDGSTAWQVLYDDYPSQGTDTFIGDFGNYNAAPQILHPKYNSTRFYRIVDKGRDSLASDEPIVSVISPTNDIAATGELTVTAVAATDQPILAWMKLYVDGQEMLPAATTTNYAAGSTNYQMATFAINTCEWGNEPHVLFATAETESGLSDALNSGPLMTGHGVSPFVPILFSNLVTRISFSQPSFDPSSGETQQISAVFASNSDWTLNITDINSNLVLTASGSGASMTYSWDGTGTGETNLPTGIYFYFISAETNGESGAVEVGGSDGGGDVDSPPSPDSPELWAVAPDSEDAVPLALFPPGSDTNGFTIFSASPSEMSALRPSLAVSHNGSFSPAGLGGSSAASQSAPAAPSRPPNNPIKGIAGTFGVCYDTYTGNGTNGYSVPPLDNGLHIGLDISMNNNSASASSDYPPVPQTKTEAINFDSKMQGLGWQNAFNKFDSTLSINDLIGSGTPFNNVDIGVFLSHGAYGTGGNGIDYAAGGCRQMYYPVTSGTSAQYLRLSQMNLGGSGTNGLKWMVLRACNSLQQSDWANMQSLNVKPYNSSLHLLLGENTISYSSTALLQNWAQDMIIGTNSFFSGTGYTPMTIKAAWFQAAHTAYQGSSFPSAVSFAVAGDTACQSDTLQSYSTPGGSWTYTSQQVWP